MGLIMMTRRRRLAAATLPAMALALATAGCSLVSDPGTTEDVAASPTAKKQRQADRRASPTPSPSEASASAEAAAAPEPSTVPSPQRSTVPVRLKDRLLTASELPGLDERSTWQVASTRSQEGKRPFGTCQRFAMTSIGATSVAVRRYVPTGDGFEASAGHLVADFADEATARRAYEVLTSWHEQCAERLSGYERASVGPMRDVPTERTGSAGWYLLEYGPGPGAERDFSDEQAVARVGTRVAALEVRVLGDGAARPDGVAPVAAAVRTAGVKLGW
jgi:hypothetical protein